MVYLMETIIEKWKNIKGFGGDYQISNLGRLRSFKYDKTRYLKGYVNSRGYLCVNLIKKQISKRKNIHRLTALYFVPNPLNLPEVNHLDLNKLNNAASNLEWTNERENCTHKFKNTAKTSKYTGVDWHKQRNKWRAKIHLNGKQKHLGLFHDEHEAHLAYLTALEELKLKNKYA